MKILLDTHIFLWMLAEPKRLGKIPSLCCRVNKISFIFQQLAHGKYQLNEIFKTQ